MKQSHVILAVRFALTVLILVLLSAAAEARYMLDPQGRCRFGLI
jgi:hypothetical protein